MNTINISPMPNRHVNRSELNAMKDYMDAGFDKTNDKIDFVEKKLGDIEKNLGSQISSIGNQVSVLNNKVSDLYNKVSGLDDKVSGLDDKVSGLKKYVSDGLDKMEEYVDNSFKVFGKELDAKLDTKLEKTRNEIIAVISGR